MAVTLIEKPERDGDSSPAAGSGRWAYVARVTGEANPETALLNAIIADTGFFWYNLSLKNVKFSEVGGGIYTAEVDWEYDPPDGRAQDPTDTPGGTDGPGGTAPSGTPSGPASANDPLGVNHSFEIGGRPPKIMTSLSVDYSETAGGGPAPDHGLLVNYKRDTREVDGVEVEDPALVMEVGVKFDRITMAFIGRLYAMVWHVNDDTWYHCPAGCVAFMGGHLAITDDGTWAGTFRFGLRPPETIREGQIRFDGGATPNKLPTVDVDKLGWDYTEIGYANVDDAATGLTVAKPSEMRIHRILPEVDFTDLGIGGA